MILLNSLKRASVTGALFCCLLITSAAHSVEASCRPERLDETAQVKHVHDGDTLWLTDGRKLRIIGINTPELARDEKPAEPLAEQARDSLRRLLGKSPQIRIRYGKEKADRYDRLLAHVFLPDDTSISEYLLRQGLAYSLTVPPNVWLSDCYQRAELAARDRQQGLWSKQYYSVLNADRLSTDTRGFQIIRGRITRIGRSRKTVWLNFNRDFAVRIMKQDLDWFKGMDLEKLTGKSLEVRGWVQYHKGQLRMRIKHPSAISILP